MRRFVFLPPGAGLFLGPVLAFVASTGHAAGPLQDLTAPAEPALPSLSLPAAIAYAQAHQPELLAARARLRAAEQEAEVPSAQWLPSLGVMGELVASSANNSTATPLTDRAVDLPRIGGTTVTDHASFRPEPTTLLAIGARQELYDFGRIAAQSAAAKALSAIATSDVRRARLEITLAVTDAYYAVRTARALLEVATQAERRAALHRDFAQASVQSGLRSPIEVTRADADVTRFEVARIRARGSWQIARGVFAAAIGYAQPELDAAPDEPPERPLPTLARAQARAVELDPGVQLSIGRVRAERALADAISASNRPNLALSAEASLRAGGARSSNGVVPDGQGFVPNVPNYSAGLVLDWPLFEASVDARARAAHGREHALATEVEVARLNALSRARQAYQNVEVARLASSALDKAAQAARANHEQAEVRFRAGLGTSTELADAETLRLNAEVEQVLGLSLIHI